MDKFDEELDRLKDIKSKEILSDEFKDNLVKRMDEEYSKTKKDKFIDFSGIFKKKPLSFSQRFAIVFSLLVIISGAAFGKNVVDWAKEVFSNQDKSIDLAIENGNYQEIDMDYIIQDGVGIKVDYVYSDDSCLYIAFNIKTEKQYNDIYIKNIELVDGNNEYLYNLDSKNMVLDTKLKRITKYNHILLVKINKAYKEDIFQLQNDLIIKNFKIFYEENGNQKEVNGNWNFNIKLDDFFIKN